MTDSTYIRERLASLPDSQRAAVKAAGLTVQQKGTTLQILEYQDDENYPTEYLGTVYCECGPHKPYSARTLDSLRKRGIIEMYVRQAPPYTTQEPIQVSSMVTTHGVYFCRVIEPKIREEDFGGDDSDGYSLKPTFGEKEYDRPIEQDWTGYRTRPGDYSKASTIPVIQMLDKKVRYYRGGTPYSFDYLDNLSYAKLEELKDDLIQRYNQALAEEDRANGECVRLNGLSGEFQRVEEDDTLTAAAPDMLKALKAVIEWAGKEDGHFNRLEEADEALLAAQAAIRLATGEEN